MNARPLTADVRSWLLPAAAVLLLAASVFYAGMLQNVGGARDIDTRYFYIAARCWASGQSPYDSQAYFAMYRAAFGTAPGAPFVAYLPTLMPVVLPLAPFGWSTAARLFSWMNFGAAMVLLWACYRLVRESTGAALRPGQWFWVCLGCTIGGIAGTISTGQTSLFIAAAMAVALLGCRLRNPWLTVAGMLVASAKPQLSGPLLLMLLVFEPQQRRTIGIAALLGVLIVGYAAAVDPNLPRSYLHAVQSYSELQANDPLQLIGLVSLLLRLGVPSSGAQLLGLAALAGILAIAAWRLHRSGRRLSEDPIAILLLIFSIGVAKPIQGYDVCSYATGIALLALIPALFEWLLLLPGLLLWRPAIAAKLHVTVPANFILTFASTALLIGALVMALSCRPRQTTAAPTADALQ